MFESLSQRLVGILDKLRGRGVLTEADITAAMREIRIALLEADVALPVVKEFIESVKQKALGKEVIQSITPGQLVVKIVHDHLLELLGSDQGDLNLKGVPPVCILMVGLQGAGKTTATAKIAAYLKKTQNKKILMASLDVYRPAAREQLQTLGQQIQIETLPLLADETPLQITHRALQHARVQGMDVLFLDTAGRLHIDETLMDEVGAIRDLAKPTETLLVADAMTGQDAVKIAQAFQERVGVTGIMLTRIDGDARGGAALSMRLVAKCPIKFLGTGEKVDQIEVFQPERLAGRILDMGDIVSLVEKAVETISQDDAEKMALRLQKGLFTLNDFANQLEQMIKMGGMTALMSFLPGMGRLKDQVDPSKMDDKVIHRQLAILRSMTPQERLNAHILNGSRRRRIALGAGVQVSDVNRLVKQHDQMQGMMKKFKGMGMMGKMGQGLKGLFGG